MDDTIHNDNYHVPMKIDKISGIVKGWIKIKYSSIFGSPEATGIQCSLLIKVDTVVSWSVRSSHTGRAKLIILKIESQTKTHEIKMIIENDKYNKGHILEKIGNIVCGDAKKN